MNTRTKKPYEKPLCRAISIRAAQLLINSEVHLPYDPNSYTDESL